MRIGLAKSGLLIDMVERQVFGFVNSRPSRLVAPVQLNFLSRGLNRYFCYNCEQGGLGHASFLFDQVKLTTGATRLPKMVRQPPNFKHFSSNAKI